MRKAHARCGQTHCVRACACLGRRRVLGWNPHGLNLL